jgi:hypothetical protein
LSFLHICLKFASTTEVKRELAVCLALFFLATASAGWAQTSNDDTSYTVQGATPEREALLRRQIQVMQPPVLPYRIRFVPHWQYLYAARMYQLHVPTGMTSKMFHPPGQPEHIR